MITVVDNVGILNTQQKADLEATPSQFHVTAIYLDVSRVQLQEAAKACVKGANDLCVAMNPKGKFTFTVYGIDVAAKDDGDVIGRSGNQTFRQGDWKGGVLDIVSRAQALHQRTNQGTVVISQPTQVVHEDIPAWPFVLGGLAFILLFVLAARAMWRMNKRTREVLSNAQSEVANLASANIDHDRWSGEISEAPPTKTLDTSKAPIGPQGRHGHDHRHELAGPQGQQGHSSNRSRRVREPIVQEVFPVPQTVIVQRDSSSEILNGMAVQSMVDYNRDLTLSRLRERESRDDYRESPHHYTQPATESYSSPSRAPDPDPSPSFSSDSSSYSSDTSNDIGGSGGGDIGGGDIGGSGGGDI